MQNVQRGELMWLTTPKDFSVAYIYAISADGSVVVGRGYKSGIGKRAFRWTTHAGMQDLGTLGGDTSEARGVSADGSVVVGWATDASGAKRAFRWTAQTGIQDLGTLGGDESEANSVSADGSVVVGWSYNRQGKLCAFRWTAQTGMEELGSLGGDMSEAHSVSADGSVVVGWAFNALGERRAFRWTAQTGMEDIGDLGGFESEAYCVSADGSVIVGWSRNANGQKRAFRWTAEAGMQDLGMLGGLESCAYAVSADGSVVVGEAENANRAWVACCWLAQIGMQDLNKMYAHLLIGGSSLREAHALSPDGRYIVGVGHNPTTRATGFLLDTGVSSLEGERDDQTEWSAEAFLAVSLMVPYFPYLPPSPPPSAPAPASEPSAEQEDSSNLQSIYQRFRDEIAELRRELAALEDQATVLIEKNTPQAESKAQNAEFSAQVDFVKRGVEEFLNLQKDALSLSLRLQAIDNKVIQRFETEERVLQECEGSFRKWMQESVSSKATIAPPPPAPKGSLLSLWLNSSLNSLFDLVNERNQSLSSYNRLENRWSIYTAVFFLISTASLLFVNILLILAFWTFFGILSVALWYSKFNEIEKFKQRISSLCTEIMAQFDSVRQQTAQWKSELLDESGGLLSHIKQFYSRLALFWRDIAKTASEWGWTVGREWTHPCWESWQPADACPNVFRLGELRTVPATIGETSLTPVSLPYLLPLFTRGVHNCFLFRESATRERKSTQAVVSLCYRLLAFVPPAKLRFVFLDPVGMGDSVASLMDLKDYDETVEDSFVTSRAWSEPDQIRKQLEALKDHIATVIQERLRDKYETIEDYNREVGEIAEPYRILCVFDFPQNFDTVALEHLLSIVRSGPRCGVIPIIVMDPARKLPYGGEEIVSEMLKHLQVFNVQPDGTVKIDEHWTLHLDEPPPDELARKILHSWGSQAREGLRVEVPFEKLLQMANLSPAQWQQGSTRSGLEIPLGPIGVRKSQRLELGKGTLNHALIVGRTGSGKSNLLHVLITAAALAYPPSELRLYLIDLKTVEFVIYRDLPHAEVVAVDADREYALSVLEALYDELLQRMEKFKQFAANDLAEYRDKTGEPMPRILLLVDEFQVLFEYDDRVAVESSRILDRVVRQGRAFGMHVLLGSQSLAGRTLPRATLDQMAVRIALQCSDADSRMVLAEDNPAARRLRRPGEAIYNSANGLVEGNSQFQVAYFSDDDRDRYLQKIVAQAEDAGAARKPIVFEGNEAARLERCAVLMERLQIRPAARPRVADALVGEPVAVKPPVAVRFARRSGSHLAIITREEEEGVGMALSALVSLCAQYPPDKIGIFIADFTTADASWAEFPEILADNFPHDIQVIGRRDLLKLLSELHTALQTALEGNEPLQQDIYLTLLGLHRVRDLRQQDDAFAFGGFSDEAQPSPTKILADLLRDGPEMGIHLMLWCDTVANLRRSVDRRGLSEIGFRIAGAMSEQDSSELIDDPVAGRLDKPHRVILYDDEHPGVLTKFRPFIVRDAKWLEEIGSRLRG